MQRTGWKALPIIHKTDRAGSERPLASCELAHTCALAHPGSMLSLWEEVGEGRGGPALQKAKRQHSRNPRAEQPALENASLCSPPSPPPNTHNLANKLSSCWTYYRSRQGEAGASSVRRQLAMGKGLANASCYAGGVGAMPGHTWTR